MREIKFRFWDTKENKWMVDGRNETNIYDFAFKNGMNWSFLDKQEAIERVIVMQFTGLKDKNEKDIYEGDVLDFTVFDYNGADTQWRGVVKFEEGQWQLWKKVDDQFYGGDGAFDLWWVSRQDEEMEVIGNIYENPELLSARS